MKMAIPKCKMNVQWLIIGLLVATVTQTYSTTANWSWECQKQKGLCKRVLLPSGQLGLGRDSCGLICGPAGSLWPKPTGTISLGSTVTPVQADDISFVYPGPSIKNVDLIRSAITIFGDNLKKLIPKNPPGYNSEGANKIQIVIGSKPWSNDTDLTWDTDESYYLETVLSQGYLDILITSSSFYGFRHALETMSQLVAWDTHRETLVAADNVTITDSPAYPHRGFLVDPARNFLSTDALYRTVDAMAANKMNVLHLHLTDTHSFPYYSKRQPLLTTYGAYPEMTYSVDDMKSLVNYAKVRGVRVLPEFDAPAHAGSGWDGLMDDSGLGTLAVCVAAQPWRKLCIEPPCGQLNPINPNLYPILRDIYADMVEDFEIMETPVGGSTKGPLLHMGGDEVYMGCWNSSGEILQWMQENGYLNDKAGFLRLWANFQAMALRELDRVVATESEADNPPPTATAILWTSDLTGIDVVEQYLDKNRYVIQAWMPASETLPEQLLDKGYRLIFSTKDTWYLDHGFGNWKGTSISGYPFHPWQVAYDNRLPGDGRNGGRVLGGEAALWGEMVDGESLDSKAWPRGSAAAERLWTNPSTRWPQARYRMMAQRERMVKRGIRADCIQPMWCLLNEGECS
ncbi:hypothetical protein J437_LFUL007928 [Ladona fulva]|uniref:Beta-hexosaminidase n=1 Tax=Ladona fulva TaxID=123851 RepID=A0A8K0K7N0_LADFU|nr:hypothetical protein J437_LFUL007928 [Ladona fulva]